MLPRVLERQVLGASGDVGLEPPESEHLSRERLLYGDQTAQGHATAQGQ